MTGTMNYLATFGARQMFYPRMSLIASLMNLGGPDLIVILLIVRLLFGAKKLPELARGMGQAVKEFQKRRTNSATSCTRRGNPTRRRPPTSVPSTVPQNPPPASAVRPDANQTTPPGDKAGQV